MVKFELGQVMRIVKFSTLTLATFFGLYGCNPQKSFGPNFKSDASSRFITDEIRFEDLIDIVPATGRIEPGRKIIIGTEISGRVETVSVLPGDVVQKGDKLITLDREPLQLAFERASAELASAENVVKVDGIRKDYARLELARAKQMYTMEAISESSLARKQLDWNLASANVFSNSALVDIAKSKLETSKLALSRSVITSPVEGTVLSINVTQGETINSSQASPKLLTLQEASDLVNIKAFVSEVDIARVGPDTIARFRVDAYPKEVFRGTITRVGRNPKMEGRFVSYPVDINAQDQKGLLFPGMTANVELVNTEAISALTMPIRALYYYPPGYIVDVPEDARDMWESYVLDEGLEPGSALEGAKVAFLFFHYRKLGLKRIFVLENGEPSPRHVRILAESRDRVAIDPGVVNAGERAIVGETMNDN